jgi:hypothetical protein
MKSLKLLAMLLGVALVVSLSGCGSGNRESSASPALQASQACIACHNTTLSPVTGNSIVTEWLRSAHNTLNGAGCNDCHKVGGHPADGSIPAIPNDLVCVTCHTVTVPMRTAAPHFSNISASYLGGPLSKLARTLINPATGDPSSSSCNGCHNPHDVTTLLPVNQQWAQSAHAATNDGAFKETIFIGRSPCGRCHSATGYRYYMTNKQTIISKAILGQYSTAKEVISCNACHTNYSWKRIATDPNVTTFVNYSTPYARFANVGKFFPGNLNNPTLPVSATRFDVGDTNLCIACHGGREGRSGATIVNTGTAITGPTDPHYFPAAGVMYMKIGFIDFVPQSTVIPAPTTANPAATTTYGKTLISSDDLSGGVTSTHRKLGTTAIHGDSHNPSFFVPGNLDSGGPCVTCHMSAGHTWQIIDVTFNKVCINCHTSERGTPLNASNFLSAFVDENRDQMNNALALAVVLLEQRYDITVQLADIEEPQEATFVRKSTGLPVDLTAAPFSTLPLADQYSLRGAMFNVALGYKENTAFLHARSYMRRIIYDTIDFLDDGVINMSVAATALNPAIGGTIKDAAGNLVFAKNATRAFTDSTLTALAPPTTPSMTFLLGFSRTSGFWNPNATPALPERP